MITRIVAVGRLKERHWQEGVMDYSRRLAPFTRLDIAEVGGEPIPTSASPAQEAKIKDREGSEILSRTGREPIVALEREGRALDSLELSRWIEARILAGEADISWVIGGPLGLSPAVLKRASLVLSLSKMTLPHQMARLFLMEQIYRAFKIMHNEPYHR
ncbi:MAG: 23S rRNA (pseudouridine(1915)-N(3))-methyltransferase RlmH [Methanotrichaceae archaeon]|nr:23S rRNA (pseudouridine(1915)-N(3))-methyltransferase RlmH [Methanotrichaceae archaeon]